MVPGSSAAASPHAQESEAAARAVPTEYSARAKHRASYRMDRSITTGRLQAALSRREPLHKLRTQSVAGSVLREPSRAALPIEKQKGFDHSIKHFEPYLAYISR